MARLVFSILFLSFLSTSLAASLGVFSGDLTNTTASLAFPSLDTTGACTQGEAHPFLEFPLTVPDSSPFVIFRKLVRSDWSGAAAVIIYSSFQTTNPCSGRVATLSADDEQGVNLNAGQFTIVVTSSSANLKGSFVVQALSATKNSGSASNTWTPQSDATKCDQVVSPIPLLFVKFTPTTTTDSYDLHIVADTTSLTDSSTLNIFYWIYKGDFPDASTTASSCSLSQPPTAMLPLQTPPFRGASTIATLKFPTTDVYTIFVALVQAAPLSINFGLIAEKSVTTVTQNYGTAGFHAPTVSPSNAAGCLDEGNSTGNWIAYSFKASTALTFVSLWSSDDFAGSQAIVYSGENYLAPPLTCNGYLTTSIISNTGLASQAGVVVANTLIGATYTVVLYSNSNATSPVSMGLFLLPYAEPTGTSLPGVTRSPTIGIDAGVYKDLFLHLQLSSCLTVAALKSALSTSFSPAVPISQVQVIQIQCDVTPISADVFISTVENYTIAESDSVYALNKKINAGDLKSENIIASELRNTPPKKKIPTWLIALIICAVIFVVLAAAAAFVVLKFMKPKKEVEDQKRRQSLLNS